MRKESLRRGYYVNLAFGYGQVAIAIGTGLVMMPLYVKYIGVNLFGAWNAIASIVTWVSILDTGISGIIQQRSASTVTSNDRNAYAQVIWVAALSGLMLMGAVLICGFALLPAVAALGARLLPEHALELSRAFKVSLAGLALTIFGFNGNALLQGRHRFTASGIVNLGSSLIGALVTLVLLLVGFGVMAIAAGTLARGTVFGLGAWSILLLDRNEPAPRENRSLLREMTVTSLYTFGGRALAVIGGNIDSFLIATIISPFEAGKYAVAKRLFDALRMLMERPYQSAGPVVSSKSAAYSPAEKIRLVQKMILGPAVCALLAIVGLCRYADTILEYWVGPVIQVEPDLLATIGTMTLATCYFAVTGALFNFLGEFRYYSVISFCQNAVVIVGGYYFISTLGIGGYLKAISIISAASAAFYILFITRKWTGTIDRSNASAVAICLVVIGASWWMSRWAGA